MVLRECDLLVDVQWSMYCVCSLIPLLEMNQEHSIRQGVNEIQKRVPIFRFPAGNQKGAMSSGKRIWPFSIAELKNSLMLDSDSMTSSFFVRDVSKSAVREITYKRHNHVFRPEFVT